MASAHRSPAFKALAMAALAAQSIAPGGAAAQASGRAILAAQPTETLQRLEREGVILVQEFSASEPHGGDVRALVIFERPIERVMDLLVQVERQHEYRPELHRVEPVLRTDTGNLSEYQMKIMLMRIRYRAHYEWNLEERRIWWSLDPDFDNGLTEIEGSWEFYELDAGRTLARFATRVNVGAGLPAFLQDFATRQKVPQAMENTRKWVDSDGRHRP